MKKHNASKVVLVTMLIFLLFTWIFPAAYYSGEFQDQGRIQMGLFDLFNYPLTALSYFGYIAFYIILVGGFYGILYKIPAYRNFLDKIVDNAKGKEKIAISIMVICISLLVSLCGLQYGIAILIPFIVSIILLMGYDKIVAAMVTVGGISAGLIGTTYAYNNLSVLLDSLSLKIDYQIAVRCIILLVADILVIFNILMYMKNCISISKNTVKRQPSKVIDEDEDDDDDYEEDEVEDEDEEEEVVSEKVSEPTKKVNDSSKKKGSKSNSKSGSKSKTANNSNKKNTKSSKAQKSVNKAALKDEDVIVIKNEEDDDLIPNDVNKKHSVWPFVCLLGLLFILLILAFVTWGENGFNVTVFENATKEVQDFKLFKFPLFAKILGTVNAFGTWTITDMFAPMFLTALLLVIIYKVKMEDVIDGFAKGAKRAIEPAAVTILVYSILVLVTYHPFQLTIYKAILGSTKGFNIATTALVSILAGLFNGDMAYSVQGLIPYYISVVTKSDNYPLVAIIFQSMYGLTMLVAPTSLILMGTLSYLNISYKEWFKCIWKLLLESFILLLIVFIILAVV